MKKQRLKINSNFTQLLNKLGADILNPCLFAGEGWIERTAWNPCDEYILDAGKKPGRDLEGFIDSHTKKGHLVAGYLSYDLGLEIHGLAKKEVAGSSLPYVVLFAYNNYLEKQDGEVYVYYENNRFINDVLKIDNSQTSTEDTVIPDYQPAWTKKSFSDAFEKIKKYIFDGYIYQINLAHELTAEFDTSPRRLFMALSKRNKAKMKAYVECPDFELLSMSPERFIRSTGRKIETSPIKGTRPRGFTPEDDKANEINLLDDDKEKAELNMITDLLRNDLGKVCSAGSVKVIKKRQIEKFTSVMHTSSLIRGTLAENMTPIKALLSMFPGGSITGCPKKKAMEIIEELEEVARGPYCGSMVVIDKDGNLDSNILIRTIIKTGSKLSLSVGSGIVYDSKLENEYQETLDKASPLAGKSLKN